MDFQLSEEQALLAESLGGWLDRNYTFEDWRKLVSDRRGFSEENWREFARMGWLGLGVPETHGGLGYGPMEEKIVGEAFGRRLVVEPYFSSAVLSSELILGLGDEPAKREWLPRLAEGRARLAFAHAERISRFALNVVATRARRSADGHRISGEKILVLDAVSADRWLVLARMDGEISDTAGLGVFCVNPASPGISIRNYATVDDRRAADITFDNTPAETLLGSGSGAYRAVERAVERAVVYLCAEGLGAMQALSEATLAYVRVRQQFGQPIGNFQSLQHRIVDMRVQLELSRAITLRACASLELSPNERARAVSAAKAHVGRSARVVGRAAIQLHGGIGMTNELAIGQYFKRLLFVETMLGDIDFHQKRFMNFVSAA